MNYSEFPLRNMNGRIEEWYDRWELEAQNPLPMAAAINSLQGSLWRHIASKRWGWLIQINRTFCSILKTRIIGSDIELQRSLSQNLSLIVGWFVCLYLYVFIVCSRWHENSQAVYVLSDFAFGLHCENSHYHWHSMNPKYLSTYLPTLACIAGNWLCFEIFKEFVCSWMTSAHSSIQEPEACMRMWKRLGVFIDGSRWIM